MIIINDKPNGKYLDLIFDGGYYCTFEISSYYYELLGTDMCFHCTDSDNRCKNDGFGIYAIRYDEITKDVQNYNISNSDHTIKFPGFGAFGDLLIPRVIKKTKVDHLVGEPRHSDYVETRILSEPMFTDSGYDGAYRCNNNKGSYEPRCISHCSTTHEWWNYDVPNVVVSVPRTHPAFSFAVQKVTKIDNVTYRYADFRDTKSLCCGFARMLSDDPNFKSIGSVYTRPICGQCNVWREQHVSYTCMNVLNEYAVTFIGLQTKTRSIENLYKLQFYVVNEMFLLKQNLIVDANYKNRICWVSTKPNKVPGARGGDIRENVLVLSGERDPISSCSFNFNEHNRIGLIVSGLGNINSLPIVNNLPIIKYEPYFIPLKNPLHEDAVSSNLNVLIPLTFQTNINKSIVTIEDLFLSMYEHNTPSTLKKLDLYQALTPIKFDQPQNGDNYPIFAEEYIEYLTTRGFVEYLINSFGGFEINFSKLSSILQSAYIMYLTSIIETAYPQKQRIDRVSEKHRQQAYQAILYFMERFTRFIEMLSDSDFVKYINTHINIQYLITIQTHTDRVIYIDLWKPIVDRYCKLAKYSVDLQNPFLIQPSLCSCNPIGANKYESLIELEMPQYMKDIQRVLTHNKGYNCTLKTCQDRTITFLPSSSNVILDIIPTHRDITTKKQDCPKICVQDLNLDIKKSYISDIIQYCGEKSDTIPELIKPSLISDIKSSIPDTVISVSYLGLSMFIMLIIVTFIIILIIYKRTPWQMNSYIS